jgi:preprotein translocase subunit SecY
MITLASRKIAIQIPQRTMARGRQREAARNHIPIRINSAGVMPIIFAQSLVVVPGAIASFSGNARLADFADKLAPGTWINYLLMAVLIIFFTYFYTSIIFNPADLSENLKKQGGFIPGIKPGAKTAEHIGHIVERVTLPGAIFLTIIALLPIWLADALAVPFQFGGTSLLIVVGVALDTMAQVQQHLLLRKYDGFMKKGRVRFRGRNAGAGGFN